MDFLIEVEREDDGRWLAEMMDLPGVIAYGESEAEARSNAIRLAAEVVADRQRFGEMSSFESPGGTECSSR